MTRPPPPPLPANCLMAKKGSDGPQSECDLSLPRRMLVKMAKKRQKKKKLGSNETVPLEPTEIQRHAWPILLLGDRSRSSSQMADRNRNMICVAQTGSGKTLTYGIPLVQHCAFALLKSSNVGGVLGLVLAPTRELALQVSDQLQKVVRCAQKDMKGDTDIDVVAIYGGVDKKDQMRRIRGENVESDASGADCRRGVILAATTGRLVDLLETETTLLNSTRFLVIDEADRMAQSAEIRCQVDTIVATMPHFPAMTSESSEYTSCLFSATLPRDDAVKSKFTEWVGSQATAIHLDKISIGKETQAEPSSAPDASGSDVEPNSEKKRKRQATPLDLASIPTNITQIVHVCSTHKKPKKLISMLDKIRKDESKSNGRTKGLCLIFFGRIKNLKYIATLIEKEGHRCAQLHSGISQSQREKVVMEFKAGKTPTLLATDVAARGLHANNVRVVINYDFPGSLGEYVHRAGRAGRDKQPAHVFGYFTREMKQMAPDLLQLLKATGSWIDPNLLALVPDAVADGNGDKKKKRRRKNTKNKSKPNESVAGAVVSKRPNDSIEDEGNGDDEFAHLSANRIVLKRAAHVPDDSDSSSGEE